MTITTHHLSAVHAEVWDDLAALGYSPVAATKWIFSGNAGLDGMSPIEAVKAGRAEDVRRLVMGMQK